MNDVKHCLYACRARAASLLVARFTAVAPCLLLCLILAAACVPLRPDPPVATIGQGGNSPRMEGDSPFCADDTPPSTSALSNQLGNICDRYEAIAVYGPIAGERLLQPNASQLAGLGTEDVPLLIVDHRSLYRVAQKHLLTPEQVSRLTDFMAKPEVATREAGGFSSTKSAFHWSADEATLELRRIEIGTKNHGVWLVHDLDNDNSDFSGVQFKRDW